MRNLEHAGCANLLEWMRDDPELDLLGPDHPASVQRYLTRVMPEPRPRVTGDVQTARPGWWYPASASHAGSPLWPRTPAGDDLARMFLHYGETVLVDQPDMPWRWWDNRNPWD